MSICPPASPSNPSSEKKWKSLQNNQRIIWLPKHSDIVVPLHPLDVQGTLGEYNFHVTGFRIDRRTSTKCVAHTCNLAMCERSVRLAWAVKQLLWGQTIAQGCCSVDSSPSMCKA